MNNTYNGPRPIFKEINQKIIKHFEYHQKDIHKKLEDQLKLLFSFLIISKNTATLDEINILVKNNLLREPRKTYYLVSTGRFLKISHYESFEEYRDRIFSKKIVNHYNVEVIKPIIKPIVNNVNNVNKKKIKPKKEEFSQFIIVSDDEASEDNSEASESADSSDSETDDDRGESDFESIAGFEELDEFDDNEEYNDYED